MAKLTRRGLFGLGAKALAVVGLAKVLPPFTHVQPFGRAMLSPGLSALYDSTIAISSVQGIGGVFAKDALVMVQFRPYEWQERGINRPHRRGHTDSNGYLSTRTYAAGEWEGLLAHIDNPDPRPRRTETYVMSWGTELEVA